MNVAAKPPLISLVVPAHNEAQGIAHTVEVLRKLLEGQGVLWEILIVDDGSQDDTFSRVQALAGADSRVKGLRLSRNFGKEAALLAGLKASRGDAVITLDADLQHPPSLIPDMLASWRQGAMIVHAVKRGREFDSPWARWRARLFNGLIKRLAGIDLDNASDFKLLDRRVVDVLVQQLPERSRFYRGLAEWVGYPSVRLEFDVADRAHGQSKWTLWGLVELATTALISFTSTPLRIVTVLGVFTLLFGALVATEALIGWFRGHAVSGFTTTIITLLIIGSVIMISLGVIGEYIAKIYDEIKARPVYLLQDKAGFVDAPRSSHSSTVGATGNLQVDTNDVSAKETIT
jgi:glycosyltransferase involved in cell wall biosynthesis